MESVGIESVVYSYNKNEPAVRTLGTDRGMEFCKNRPDICSNFISFVTGNSFQYLVMFLRLINNGESELNLNYFSLWSTAT